LRAGLAADRVGVEDVPDSERRKLDEARPRSLGSFLDPFPLHAVIIGFRQLEYRPKTGGFG
jgi:hypothetical protein